MAKGDVHMRNFVRVLPKMTQRTYMGAAKTGPKPHQVYTKAGKMHRATTADSFKAVGLGRAVNNLSRSDRVMAKRLRQLTSAIRIGDLYKHREISPYSYSGPAHQWLWRDGGVRTQPHGRYGMNAGQRRFGNGASAPMLAGRGYLNVPTYRDRYVGQRMLRKVKPFLLARRTAKFKAY